MLIKLRKNFIFGKLHLKSLSILFHAPRLLCLFWLVSCLFQAHHGYTNLTGVDYSQSAVDLASSVAAEEQVNIKYLVSVFFFFTVKIDLQSHLAKSTMSIDFINELIIWKMNLLVVAAASLNSNLSSGMHSEQWIFWLQLYSIQSDGKIFEWINCFEDANLYQIQENWAVRIFISTSSVNSLFRTSESEIYNY